MVQVTEKNIENQIQLWAIVGPFATLVTLLVSMMKSTPMQTSFAVCLLVGVPLCWRWKLKGLAISTGLLLGSMAYSFMDLEFSAQLWCSGLGASACLSFLITALSFDEVSALTDTLQIESKSRLESLLKLDEKLKVEKESFQKNHQNLLGHVKELEEEVIKSRERESTSERFAQTVRDELEAVHLRNNELLQEVFTLRQQYSQAEKTYQTTLAERQQNEQAEKTYQTTLADYQAKIAESDQELLVRRQKLEKVSATLVERDQELQAKNQKLEKITAALAEREQQLAAEKQRFDKVASTLAEREQQLIVEKQKLEKVASTLSERDQELLAEKQKLEKVALTLSERDQELLVEKQKLEKIEATAQEKEMVLQQLIQEANQTRDEINAKLEKAGKKESSELRKVKGMHSQLQKQFQEKSDVLDETRRALFHMQENLLTAQRDLEEMRKGDKTVTEELIEGTIERMERERRELEESHQQEIDALHDIIASLSVGKS